MSLLSLPSKIANILEEEDTGVNPLQVIRINGSLDGSSGDSYIVAYPDHTSVFSRSSGQFDYERVNLPNHEIRQPSVVKERYDELLTFSWNGRDFSLKFPRYDRNKVDQLISNWSSDAATAPTPAPDVSHDDDAESITPSVAFLALLIHAATIDGELDDTEENYIEALCHHDQGALKSALAFYKSHSLEDLLHAISGFDQKQKLCTICNLIEVVMSDGVIHSSEQILVKQVASALSLPSKTVESIHDILLAKNQTSVLGL